MDERRAQEHGRLLLLRWLRHAALAVRARRLAMGATQVALGRAAGKYANSVSKLESGSAWLDLDTVMRLLESSGAEVPFPVAPKPPTRTDDGLPA